MVAWAPGFLPGGERVRGAAETRIARRALHAAALLGLRQLRSHGRGELLATEWQGDCRALDELLAADPDARKTLDLAPLWATAGRLHDAGLYHGTFLARNILVRGGADAPQFILLDMPRCHIFPHGIRGTRMARYDLLFMANTLRRSLPADDVPRWLAAYGMSADQQSRFAADLRGFRNSGQLRRAIGAEFNLRAWLAKARHPGRRHSERIALSVSRRSVSFLTTA